MYLHIGIEGMPGHEPARSPTESSPGIFQFIESGDDHGHDMGLRRSAYSDISMKQIMRLWRWLLPASRFPV